jgi:hypothetical protein
VRYHQPGQRGSGSASNAGAGEKEVKRAAGILIVAVCALAQEGREAYREAFRSWREADPGLERDAATAGAALGARAEKVAAETAKYAAARKAFLDSRQGTMDASGRSLEAVAAPSEAPESTRNAELAVASASSAASASIQAIGSDPDRGLQQLRQSIERERAALTALSNAIRDRQNALASATRATEAAEQARMKVADHYQSLAVALQQASREASRQGSAWADYYRTLSDGARSVRPGGAAAVTGVVTGGQPVGPAPAPPSGRSVTPVPLSRYVGAWAYPLRNTLFLGAEPEFVDLVVHEENGQAAGTLYARFKLPPGSLGDPILRFDFAGSFQNARSQSFSLETSEGAKGAIELIPGPAFNLLEVNFSTETRPGKVRQGNFLLVKK